MLAARRREMFDTQTDFRRALSEAGCAVEGATVSRWEHGLSTPTRKNLLSILGVLQIDEADRLPWYTKASAQAERAGAA